MLRKCDSTVTLHEQAYSSSVKNLVTLLKQLLDHVTARLACVFLSMNDMRRTGSLVRPMNDHRIVNMLFIVWHEHQSESFSIFRFVWRVLAKTFLFFPAHRGYDGWHYFPFFSFHIWRACWNSLPLLIQMSSFLKRLQRTLVKRVSHSLPTSVQLYKVASGRSQRS